MDSKILPFDYLAIQMVTAAIRMFTGVVFFDIPSNTITTGCKNPSKRRFVHPWVHHGITLRHAARLQSFPDTYTFLGNSTEQARQIGNAVSIELGQALIQNIKEQILLNNNQQQVVA